MNNKNNRCAFLMSSCDDYEDLWNPFFESLDFYWKDIPYSVYLNTEYKQYMPRKDMGFTVTTLNQIKNKDLTWSRRFIDVLNRIDAEYIFLVLDDFFVCNTVDTEKIEEILDIMDKDKSIASFQMCGTRLRNVAPENYVQSKTMQYKELWKNGWKTHFVPTIWRKSILLKWLRPWESIWGFEGYGSDRARRWPRRFKEKVYVVENPPVYDYLWIKDCSAVIHGKWLAETELIEHFAKINIEIDYSKRGKMTHEEYMNSTMKDVIKKYTFWQIIKKCFNRFRSLF